MEDLERYTVLELQDFLRSRGLPVGYKRKFDLIERLKLFEGSKAKNKNSDQISESESGSENELEDNFRNAESSIEGENAGENEDNFEDSKSISEIKNASEVENEVESEVASAKDLESSIKPSKTPIKKLTMTSNFVFKDIEDSLDKFNGETGKDIVAWLKDYNDISTVCSWSDVQKYLYARRLLSGAARLAVEASTEVTSWEALKTFLQSEFCIRNTSISIHRRLESRKKKPDETFLEYLYAMKQIAKCSSIDEDSIVSYIIAGISDSVQNKTVLYEARTLSELKGKFKVYESMKAHLKEARPNEKSFKQESSKGKRVQNQSRCYNCGAKSHLSSNCPNRSKGSRCFSCGLFGHMAPNCPQKNSSRPVDRREASGSRINVIEVPDLQITVELQQKEYKALVDTGSGVSLIKQSVMRNSCFKWSEIGPSMLLTGFGRHLKRTLGSVLSTLIINGDEYRVRLHIVPDQWINQDILLGTNILKDAKLLVDQGRLSITKVKRNCNGVEEEDFLKKIDVVQLIHEPDLASLEEIEDANLREDVRKVVAEYKPNRPQESCIKMKIHLDSEAPIYFKPRRLSPREKEVVTAQINEWLEDGIVRPSCSDFASPVVLAKKKDESHRLCIDYRKINRHIIKDRYPLPVMEEILEDLHHASVFTTLDLRNGFFHVDIDESSKKFTAFSTADGHFEFNKMPFGLCNSPSIFQRFINVVFQPLIRDGTLLIYMDDIIIPSPNESENVDKLKKTLDVARSHGLEIKWAKCKFLRRSVEFLGHIVEGGSIKPSEEKVAAVQKFPVPRNVKQVQSFLGLTGFFRKFILNYSVIAKPLSDLIKKDTPFLFSQREQDAFNTLKAHLCSQPVLKLFDPRAQTELHTDASKAGYGAVLLQKSSGDDKLHPVFYVSFKTTDVEQRYSSYELEVLAIVKTLKRLRPYLLGLKFIIYTDCKAFELTMRKKEISGRVARWALFLEEFDCIVRHKSGSAMRHVDALSRYPAVMMVEDDILHRIKKAQEEDDFCQAVKKCLEQGEYQNFLLRGQVLFKFLNGDYLLVVPKTMQKGIISNAHENGHINAKKLEVILRQDYYIPNLAKKIQDALRNCVPCILVQRKAGKPECLFNPIDKQDQPLHTFHLDHLGPLQSTSKNYKHLFVVIDAFSKFSWIYPVKSTTTDEVIRKLELQADVFGNPHSIVTDKGTAFTSTSFREYCEARNITQVFITTGVPRGNGQVERLNQIIINVLSKMSIPDPTKWYKHVPHLQRVLNSTPSRSTGKTPFQLMFGVKMFNPSHQRLKEAIEEEIVALFESERDVHRLEAKRQIAKIQEENVRYSRKRRKPAKKYKLGDLVAIKKTQFAPGSKLFPKFLGPYEVTGVRYNDRYDVKKVGNHEGPNSTSSAADYMKPWSRIDEDEDLSEADEAQDGRMWDRIRM